MVKLFQPLTGFRSYNMRRSRDGLIGSFEAELVSVYLFVCFTITKGEVIKILFLVSSTILIKTFFSSLFLSRINSCFSSPVTYLALKLRISSPDSNFIPRSPEATRNHFHRNFCAKSSKHIEGFFVTQTTHGVVNSFKILHTNPNCSQKGH